MCDYRVGWARYTASPESLGVPDGLQISHPSDAGADLDQLGKSAVPLVQPPRGRWQEDGQSLSLAHRAVGGAVRAANRRLLQRLDRTATRDAGSQPVDEKKQPQPYHVDEVPVPGDRFETKMSLGREVAVQDPKPDHRQHDGPDRDMQAVKSGQHEKRGAINAGAESQSGLRVGLMIFRRL